MSNRAWESLQRFWIADRGLSVFVAILVVATFVLPAFGRLGPLTALVSDLGFSALLVAGALTLRERRWMRLLVPPLAALALLIRWASVAGVPGDHIAWREFSTLITLTLFAVVVAGQVYRTGPVTHHRIQGAVAVYLLLGLMWASAYALLHHLRPGAFTGSPDAAALPQTWIYYSFVTLTTTGYGDISPVHPVARSLAIAEAVAGQLYIAVTLARLVALYVGARGKQ
jgi:hypothetical protein